MLTTNASAASVGRCVATSATGCRQMQILAEGILGVDQKLDRFRGEVHEEFARVARRLLRLEARVLTADQP
jgi:hypothetical protein